MALDWFIENRLIIQTIYFHQNESGMGNAGLYKTI